MLVTLAYFTPDGVVAYTYIPVDVDDEADYEERCQDADTSCNKYGVTNYTMHTQQLLLFQYETRPSATPH